MKNTIWLLIILVAYHSDCWAQLHIANGTTITVADIELFTQDSITGNGTIDATTGTLTLGSNASMRLKNNSFTNNQIQTFRIDNGTNFTIPNNKDLTVTQHLTLDGSITVAKTGALIQTVGSTYSGSGAIEVHKTGFPSGPIHKYNFFSSPTTNSSIGTLSGYRYYFNPANVTTAVGQGWVWYTSGIMSPGRGYIATNSGNVVFSGPSNNGPIYHAAYDQTLNTAKVMNVIGNPYPSGLDLLAFANANPALTGVFYFWDDNGSQGSNYTNNGYATWSPAAFGTWVQASNGGNKIMNGHNQAAAATCQGFVVLPTNANPPGSFTIEYNNSMRVANGSVFFKPQKLQRFYINLLEDTTFLSQCAIVFDSAATKGYDERLDALRIANSNSPLVNAKINHLEYAIAAYPNNFDSSLVIPLSIWVPQQQDYQFIIPKLENLSKAEFFWLNDSTGTITPLADSNNVFVEPLKHGVNSHLYIAVKPKQKTIPTAVTPAEAQSFDAFITPSQLVLVNAPAENSNLKLFNASGQLVDIENIQQNYYFKNLATGIYIAQIQSANSFLVKKFLVP